LEIEAVNNVKTNKSNDLTQTAVKIKPIQEPTLLQNLQASPRNSTDIILYIIFGLLCHFIFIPSL